jgi:hypothetical protein
MIEQHEQAQRALQQAQSELKCARADLAQWLTDHPPPGPWSSADGARYVRLSDAVAAAARAVSAAKDVYAAAMGARADVLQAKLQRQAAALQRAQHGLSRMN